MEAIKLKNGSEEDLVFVNAIMFGLRSLIKEKPIFFQDLVMKSRDGDYKIFSESIEMELKGLGMLESDGSVHGSIRNIVLSAVSGDDSEMVLGSPVQK